MLTKNKKGVTKKKNNKKFLIPSIFLIAFLVVGVYGATQISADDTSNYPPIVQKIASRFGLNETDVEEVFQQERADMWEKRHQMFSDRLEQAVEDGKITEEQKQKILDKQDEIQADREAQRQQFKEDMQQWMQDNGIDSDALLPYLGFGGFGKVGFHRGRPVN